MTLLGDALDDVDSGLGIMTIDTLSQHNIHQ
jgi:hypothetical protein